MAHASPDRFNQANRVRSRKPLCVVKAYRGFESLPLRSAVVKNAMFMPDWNTDLPAVTNAQTGWQRNHYSNNHGYPTLIQVS